jgi:hypothetical protein
MLTFVFAFSLLGMPARVAAQENPPSIGIGVVPNTDAVYLWNWETGANVTLTIDAIRNGIPINYSTSMIVPEFDMVFYVGNAFDIQVGDVVTVSDGITTKTVTASNVRILGINLDTDTVIGTADPLDTIQAYIYGNCSPQVQWVTADDNGVWNAIFAGCNFNDLTRITASEIESYDATLFEFYVPYIVVNPQDNKVDGFKWLLGNLVTLTIDDPINGVGIDYAETKTVLSSDWDRNQTYISFDLGTFKIHPGDLVTMTDGITTKTAIVVNLVLGGGSVINDRVWGTADPGAVIQVFNRDNPNVYRNVNTNAQGNWTADFSVPGDGQPPFDIQPGNVMFADQKDEDGDRTRLTWIATNPPVNSSPVITIITAPVDPQQVNTNINVTADFTDPDINDTHSATWDWGDGSTSSGIVDESSKSMSGSHVYTTAGVYTIKVTLTDAAGAFDDLSYNYVVIYDPGAGFVTGGGWNNSPAGAYTADPSLTGKATFGFVSKYQKGANVPTGNTEFQFKVANLNFSSTTYDWLVVAGAKAQFKGTGTINGAGSYRFMLTAIDGQINGGGGVDKFRIKIWDPTTGQVIYDNQMGAGDDALLTTAIQGGSIVIHK